MKELHWIEHLLSTPFSIRRQPYNMYTDMHFLCAINQTTVWLCSGTAGVKSAVWHDVLIWRMCSLHPSFCSSHMLPRISADGNTQWWMAVRRSQVLLKWHPGALSLGCLFLPLLSTCQPLLRLIPSSGTMRPWEMCQHSATSTHSGHAEGQLRPPQCGQSMLEN